MSQRFRTTAPQETGRRCPFISDDSPIGSGTKPWSDSLCVGMRFKGFSVLGDGPYEADDGAKGRLEDLDYDSRRGPLTSIEPS
jgi:hypothetical protein